MAEFPNEIAQTVISLSDNPFIFLLLVNILLLIVGTFMETIASVIILTPILFPLATGLGIDPIHFGIIMIVNLSIGFITPPLGLNLFVASGVSNLKIETISQKIMPGFLALVTTLLIITYVSWLSLVFI